MIERVARVSDPALAPELCRYTRRLTAVWCAYFVATAVWLVAAKPPADDAAMLIWLGTGLLFVGEHWLRRRLFPARRFPGLRQQLRDTLHVWRLRA